MKVKWFGLVGLEGRLCTFETWESLPQESKNLDHGIGMEPHSRVYVSRYSQGVGFIQKVGQLDESPFVSTYPVTVKVVWGHQVKQTFSYVYHPNFVGDEIQPASDVSDVRVIEKVYDYGHLLQLRSGDVLPAWSPLQERALYLVYDQEGNYTHRFWEFLDRLSWRFMHHLTVFLQTVTDRTYPWSGDVY